MLFGKKKEPEQELTSEMILYSSDKKRILSMVHKMGEECIKAVASAVEALVERNNDLAQKVIDNDDVIDKLEVEIDQECLGSIAMRQPVRENLRFVFAVAKIVTDLERIGDEAVNIAERVLFLNKYPLLKPLIDIPKMKNISTEMLRNALNAFETNNPALAEEVYLKDQELDILYFNIFEELIQIIALKPKGDKVTAQCAAALMWIGRHLERVGDHASNVAEKSYFIITGKRLKQIMEEKQQEM
ncbi:MAG: phosphate signaling complex protein PhoU [Aminobacterium sp.]|jgi:phosphate transport system protein|uniref:phosphate signaling complex protein PhoU n=1 Tax=unclassified Aminobacterium TaxID=2685012 RepID=UPI0027DD7645|nr:MULTISPECIES: phosphate signaling complex protein PhoU [unclassified Aminobacterium]MDD2207593.1 phosphate signaling complex protein PhoU [Aminobacterium sp.]MDD3426651.1 phosphate signaling complex protein PhoU [Aminobacterium sp.]MDD3708279.1 phosphate signaling complex protein PhoU [Aminobacterium sp.]MDD4229581.1 phosphate signaling complex protein PhoU [Aminobacterium sp.]MDD4552450.1 phosphate signaling complex protein PhoU [Aminobacterium sp.]